VIGIVDTPIHNLFDHTVSFKTDAMTFEKFYVLNRIKKNNVKWKSVTCITVYSNSEASNILLASI